MHISKKMRLSIFTLVLMLIVTVFIGCAPRQAPADLSEPELTTILPEWSMQSDCSTCHLSAEDSRKDTAVLASNTEHATADCVTCHEDESGLSEAHKDATSAPTQEITRLRKSDISNESCLSCHDSAEIAQLTVASTALTDKDGTVVDPHNLPVNDNHATINCGSCHTMHKPAAVNEDAYKLCAGCHHQEIFTGCETCHGPGGV
jgi:predicted CXXCH cytochrome family protein